MRIAGIEKQGVANGPGLRLTVFAQGCAHYCKGCHNIETWNFEGGTEYTVEEVYQMIKEELKANPLLDGVTFSGGDPFYQAKDFAQLAAMIKNRHNDIGIWCYTGFTVEELFDKDGIHDPDYHYSFPEEYRYTNDKWIDALFQLVDVVVDGPYVEELRDLDFPYRGSRNQRLIITQECLEDVALDYRPD